MAGPIKMRRVILTNVVLIFLLLVINQPDELVGGSSKSKSQHHKKMKPFVVNPDLPYYKGKFYPCKGTRDMNPVETVRARNWATQVG